MAIENELKINVPMLIRNQTYIPIISFGTRRKDHENYKRWLKVQKQLSRSRRTGASQV